MRIKIVNDGNSTAGLMAALLVTASLAGLIGFIGGREVGNRETPQPPEIQKIYQIYIPYNCQQSSDPRVES
jgi:hypothetical protein